MSSSGCHLAEIDAATGRALSLEEVRAKRKKQGLCPTCPCPNQLFRIQKKRFNPLSIKRVPLTVRGKVLNGRCLRCDLTAKMMLLKEQKNGRALNAEERTTKLSRGKGRKDGIAKSPHDKKDQIGSSGDIVLTTSLVDRREKLRKLQSVSTISTASITCPSLSSEMEADDSSVLTAPSPFADSESRQVAAEDTISECASSDHVDKNLRRMLLRGKGVRHLCNFGEEEDHEDPEEVASASIHETEVNEEIDTTESSEDSPNDIIEYSMCESSHSDHLEELMRRKLCPGKGERSNINSCDEEVAYCIDPETASEFSLNDKSAHSTKIVKELKRTRPPGDPRHVPCSLSDIIEVLFSESVSAQEQREKCENLVSLAVDNTTKYEIILSGGMMAIQQIMKGDFISNASLQEKACKALHCLIPVASDDTFDDLPIVETVINIMIQYPDIPGIQEHGVGILWNLSTRNNHNKNIIAQCGGIDIVFFAMNMHTCDIIQKNCREFLCSMATQSDNYEYICQNGGGKIVDGIETKNEDST